MDYQRLDELIEQREEEGLKLLETIVNIDSPSRDRQGVNAVGEVICQYLKQHHIDFKVIENKDKRYGDFIIAHIPGNQPGKILIMGHRDTVFPIGTAKKRPFKIEGHLAFGPGVSDMKSGIVTSLLAVIALKESQMDLCDLEILITPDEEIGSPTSRPVIEERAKEALAVFNLEPGRPDGSVATARRGSAHLEFLIEGRSAHSGTEIEKGISAIEELGHKIIQVQQLTDMSQGVSVNVGLVQGGENTNMVAPHASGTIHIGFETETQFQEIYEKIKAIFDKSYVEGTRSILKGHISFLPMEKHEGVKKLYEIVKENGRQLGISVPEQHTRGAADSGFTASLGVPTICGMGPVGGKWHNEGEYMEVDTFIPRTKLLAYSIISAFHTFR